MPMLDNVLHVLMVIHTTITNERGTDLPIVSREDIRHATKQHFATLSDLESEPDRKTWQLTETTYPEPALLAYVIGYLKDNGNTGTTERQRMFVSMLKVALDLYVDAYHN